MTDPITESDLLGYVDDQIDAARRIDVEDYLAKRPDMAARVMADLKARDALRLTLAGPMPPPSERMTQTARRLQRALAWRETGLRLGRAAALIALVAAGWFAHAQVGLGISDSAASTQPPPFVEEARRSHETALLRSHMQSQPAAARYDPAEILAATGLRLPTLPGEWRVLDAEVFPARDGHSVEVAIEAGNLGRISLFAAHVPGFDVIDPTMARGDGAKAVYWQTGPVAYALTGSGDDDAMAKAAARLSRQLH